MALSENSYRFSRSHFYQRAELTTSRFCRARSFLRIKHHHLGRHAKIYGRNMARYLQRDDEPPLEEVKRTWAGHCGFPKAFTAAQNGLDVRRASMQ